MVHQHLVSRQESPGQVSRFRILLKFQEFSMERKYKLKMVNFAALVVSKK